MTDRTGATKKWNRIIIISCWMSVLLATTTVSSFQTSPLPRRNRGIKGVSYNKATTTVVELINTNEGVTKTKRKVRKKAVKKKKKKKSTVVLSIDNTANDTLDAVVKKKAKRKGKTKGSKTKGSKTTSKTVDETKKKKKKFEFWSSTDPYIRNATHVQCTVRGNPQPLRRHRTGRGFLYNPSAPAQKAFRAVALEILGLNADDSTTKNATSPTTHFGAALHVHIVFHCQRPKHHFTASRPGPGRLKVTAPATVQRRVDVDNLAKFVLDCFNDSALYGDDQQVVSLQGIKVYHDDDDDDDCLGKTVLSMRAMSHDEVLAEAASAF